MVIWSSCQIQILYLTILSNSLWLIFRTMLARIVAVAVLLIQLPLTPIAHQVPYQVRKIL